MVEPAYRNHFHKNLTSGDYAAMRELWSARCRLPTGVPASLSESPASVRIQSLIPMRRESMHGEDSARRLAFGAIRGTGAAPLRAYRRLGGQGLRWWSWPSDLPAADVLVGLARRLHRRACAPKLRLSLRQGGHRGAGAQRPSPTRCEPLGTQDASSRTLYLGDHVRIALYWRANTFTLDGGSAAAAAQSASGWSVAKQLPTALPSTSTRRRPHQKGRRRVTMPAEDRARSPRRLVTRAARRCSACA